MQKYQVSLVVALMLVAPLAMHARQPSRAIDVFVQYDGDDRVGRQFVRELREQLRASTDYRLTTTRDQARFTLHVVSRETVKGEQHGHYSAVATTLTRGKKESFVYLVVQVVGESVVPPAVRTMVATLEPKIDEAVRRGTIEQPF